MCDMSTLLDAALRHQGIDPNAVRAAVRALPIETPSWGYGNAGTRFKVFRQAAAARDAREKIADAALVQRFTGACPSVALHIPWDKTDDWAGLAAYARGLGIRLGAINPNLFQDDDYRLGSVCHPDAAVRARAIAHIKECIEIAKTVGSDVVSLWLADGTNYHGQDDIRGRRHRLLDSLRDAYTALPAGMTMLVEYKLFEPAFYHTDLADWGAAYTTAVALGPQAKVLVDTGHHAPGTNIEYIVAWLLDENRLGGFHFNCRKYADDDLIVGSSHPFELFSIFHELINGGQQGRAAEVAYMLDQSHNIENKVEAAILSVMNVQTAYAKALCVNREALAKLQQAGDVLGAHRLLHEAFEMDVRPLLETMREDAGLPADPLAAFRASGLAEKLAAERGGMAV
ncbi:MAG: L-rhamnose isomerase [Armatimonadota bacterium]